jgi:hypothetical protein
MFFLIPLPIAAHLNKHRVGGHCTKRSGDGDQAQAEENHCIASRVEANAPSSRCRKSTLPALLRPLWKPWLRALSTNTPTLTDLCLPQLHCKITRVSPSVRMHPATAYTNCWHPSVCAILSSVGCKLPGGPPCMSKASLCRSGLTSWRCRRIQG